MVLKELAIHIHYVSSTFSTIYLKMLVSLSPWVFILQVILDVVYNHTNEADDANPYTTSFRGIDNKVKELSNIICLGQHLLSYELDLHCTQRTLVGYSV